MKRKYPSADVKRLYGRAAGKCSFPTCNRELVLSDDDGPGQIGKIAHIIARGENGPRADAAYPPDKIDTYENWILLCPTCHDIVDNDPGKYTAEVLRNIKKEHELRVDSITEKCKPWTYNLSTLFYLNIPRLAMLSGMRGYALDEKSLAGIKSLHSLGIELARVMVQFQRILSTIDQNVLEIEAAVDYAEESLGHIVAFERAFRTKNIRMDDAEKPLKIAGDLKKDPHIYCKIAEWKVVMTIDPKWVTTSTAFDQFGSRQSVFAGLAMIKSVDGKNKLIFATPLVVGLPSSEFDGLF